MDYVPIVAFDRGTARIIKGTHYYIHHFKVLEMQNEINSMVSAFNVEETQFTPIITAQFEHVTEMLKTLIPRRQKRWDTVGTVWKFIAGSPDAND